MKSLSDVLHRIPWWALLAGGLALFVALVVMVVPVHLIGLEHAAATPEEKRAIKHEINSTFSEGALDMARGVLLEMRKREQDLARRKELDRSLAEIERARERVNQAGDAAKKAGNDWRSVGEAIDRATRRVQEALKEVKERDLAAKAAKAAKSANGSAVPPVPPLAVASSSRFRVS